MYHENTPIIIGVCRESTTNYPVNILNNCKTQSEKDIVEVVRKSVLHTFV